MLKNYFENIIEIKLHDDFDKKNLVKNKLQN